MNEDRGACENRLERKQEFRPFDLMRIMPP